MRIVHGLKSSALHMGATELSETHGGARGDGSAHRRRRSQPGTSRPRSADFGAVAPALRKYAGDLTPRQDLTRPGLDAPAHEARDLLDVDLVHDVRAVLLHRAHAQVEAVGDLLRGEALGDEAGDLELARRKRLDRVDRGRLAGPVLTDGSTLGCWPGARRRLRRDVGREEHAARDDGLDGLQHVVEGRALVHEAVDALRDQPGRQVAVGMARQDEDPRVRELGAHLADDLEAVHPGQVQVHDQEPRRVLEAEIEARLAVLERARRPPGRARGSAPRRASGGIRPHHR